MGEEESGRQRRGGRSVSAADLQRGDAGLRAPGKHTLSELPRMPPVDPVTEVQYQLGQARARIATIESALSAGESRRAALAATELKVHLHHARDAATFAHDQGHERGAELIAQVAEVEQQAHPAIEAAKATSTDPAAIASRATRAGGGRFPHLERIQQSFGSHDISSIQAHIGGDASDAAQQLGAHAFAFGDHVAFASEPDLHTAAHEAAHVVQQRAGVALAGGIDQPGDAYEQHANQVADAVVRGESAAPLLDSMAGRGASAAPSQPPVQRKSFAERLQERALTRELDSYVDLNAPRLALALVEQLAAHLWPDPVEDVPFLPGGERKFGAYLGESLRPYLHRGTALRQLLHPSDILAQFEALISNPRLGTSWSEQFGITLAHRVQAAATASLQQRVGPRYRAALAQMVQLPTADDLIAGHPIDPLVAQALIAPHVLDNTQVAQTEKPAAQLRKLQVHWLGSIDKKLWNFVQVSPGSATVEEVAATLWRDPKKTTEAYAIQKYGDVFRVAPAQARQVIRAHHPGAVIASSDTDGDRAAQLLDLARSSVKRGDAAAKQFAGAESQAARVEDVMDIERQIGGLLDQIRAAVAPVGMGSELQIAYEARAERHKLLADGDASTRAKFLPVLQFQHTQLLTIAPKVPPLATQLKVLEGLGPGVLRQRKTLREHIKTYVQAAAVSHLRDEGTALLRSSDEEARYQTLNHLSGGQVDLHASNSEALASTGRTEKGFDEADENLERVRTAAMNGWASGLSQYEQQKALATAGEVALRARMRSAEHTLEQLQAAAIEAFGDPAAMHRMYPGLPKSLPELIADVRAHLADVNTTWTNATHEHTPAVVADKNAPADWASWQGRIAGLDAARTAFGKIAGDQSISSFIRKAQKEIQHEQFVSALIKLGAVLLITVATGMAAAELGATVSSQLAAEGAGLAARFGATVAEVSINASINTAVQMALSDEKGSVGWALVENALMDMFTRGMMGPLRKLEEAASVEAKGLSMLPHLSDMERDAVATVNFAGTQLVAEMVGGMATQWAAHRLVQLVHTEKSAQQASTDFANTVLQQGAAIGLGKFFHSRLTAWKDHRKLLAQTRVGQLPESLALFKAREQFYAEAKQLSESLSPDPAAGEKLMTQDVALLKEERALFESGPFEVTADAVPGSSFKGKGEAPTDKATLLAEAHAALEEVAAAIPHVAGKPARAHVDTGARQDEQAIATNTHVMKLGDNTSITVRIAVVPLEGQTVAKSILNPSKQGITRVERTTADGVRTIQEDVIHGRYVIQVSDKLEVVHVRRAIAHEMAEIIARRELVLRNEVPGKDVLRGRGDATAPLTPHDRGRIAEIEELTRQLRVNAGGTAERAREELVALVEDMGLRSGVDGADARMRRLEGELSSAAAAELQHARVGEMHLPEHEAKKLAWQREDAATDKRARADFERAREPLHQVPTTGLGRKASKTEREALASKAHEKRVAHSAATLAEIRAANANGDVPRMKLQIGGNAALAARDPAALLVDANQRWAVDASSEIAQTAQQMEAIKAAGIGDPYEFADAGERVPIEAVRYWQDSIAAQGPLIDGHAELELGPHGELIASIRPNDGSPPVKVQVDGVPLVATGFTRENAPGARGKSPRQALMLVERELARLERDPKVAAAAAKARAEISKLHGLDEGDAANVLAAITPELRPQLAGNPELRQSLEILEMQKKWAELRAADPAHVLSGDEANKLTDEQVAAMHRVVIAGTGGTGISAAEIILRKNATARVAMIGVDSPAGLTENNQFRSVVAKHGNETLCAELHIAPEGIDGRFEFHKGYYLGTPEQKGNAYDVNARPAKSGGAPLSPEASAGDTYVSAMGRFEDFPPPVAKLANDAERMGGKVTTTALFDADDLYVGYQVILDRPGLPITVIDITGAASRFAGNVLPKNDVHDFQAAADHDAPAEGGNFAGGYAPSATQVARFRTHRRMREH